MGKIFLPSRVSEYFHDSLPTSGGNTTQHNRHLAGKRPSQSQFFCFWRLRPPWKKSVAAGGKQKENLNEKRSMFRCQHTAAASPTASPGNIAKIHSWQPLRRQDKLLSNEGKDSSLHKKSHSHISAVCITQSPASHASGFFWNAFINSSESRSSFVPAISCCVQCGPRVDISDSRTQTPFLCPPNEILH